MTFTGGGPSRANRRAVLVGVGQRRRRPPLDGPWEAVEPSRMMAEVLRDAAHDAGDVGLIQEADVLACVSPVAWTYDDLVGRVGQLAGVTGPASPRLPTPLTVAPGGSSPCELLNDIAARIVDGDARIALLTGAEAMYSRRRARREEVDLFERGWPPRPPGISVSGGQRPMANELEVRHGVVLPIHAYPLYENALRAESGRSIAEHMAFLGELMAAHAGVARDNPMAWFRDGWSADQLTTVDADNRWICFPYPKRLNAIIDVDQSAAIVVMSSDEADRRGIPASRQVTFLGGASATDAWTPTERASLTSSPAYRAAATAAFEHAALYPTEVDLFDLYSCFPSAVQFAMKALSLTLDDPRPRTVTGGLAYAGGPGNDYATHALAAMVGRLRDAPARVGYVSALGLTATKHAVSILSADPSRARASSGRSTPGVAVADRVNFGPPLVLDPAAGPATIETYTVEFDRGGAPVRSMLVLRLGDGRRTMANGSLSDVSHLVAEEGVGLRGWVEPGLAGGPNHFSLGTPSL